MPAGEIRSVQTGGNGFGATVRHSGRTIHLIDGFPVFRAFLVALKAINPDAEIRGS